MCKSALIFLWPVPTSQREETLKFQLEAGEKTHVSFEVYRPLQLCLRLPSLILRLRIYGWDSDPPGHLVTEADGGDCVSEVSRAPAAAGTARGTAVRCTPVSGDTMSITRVMDNVLGTTFKE